MTSAKGVLVVDPLEARGVRYSKKKTDGGDPKAGGIYVLFQIDNVVHRTESTFAMGMPSLKWSESSQCRFDITPEATPLLRVFVMQSQGQGRIPICLGKGEMNLIDVFYQKETDLWVTLSPVGQIDVELTFYEVVPMLPMKKRGEKQSKQQPQGVQKPGSGRETDKAQTLISSVDRVFDDDVKEERHGLRKLARKVKRRYKESLTSNYDHLHKRKPSGDMLLHEVNTSPEVLPKVPEKDPRPVDLSQQRENSSGSTSTAASTSTNGSATFDRSRVDLSALSLNDPLNMSDIDLSSIPFSASSIGKGAQMQPKLEALRNEHQRTRKETMNKTYVPVSAETYALVDRLEKGLVTPQDFHVEEGVSLYNGDGTWNRGCLRDSVPTGAPPALPPKIPVGMMSEEYFVLCKKDFVDYVKTSKQIQGV